MISPKARDMNRSRDVKGPELKRPYDQETTMKDKAMSGMGDTAPTGTLSKHPLSELHQGEEEAPLLALGKQEYKVSSPMGKEMADHVPALVRACRKAPAVRLPKNWNTKLRRSKFPLSSKSERTSYGGERGV